MPIGEKSVFLSSVEKRQLVDLLHHYASSSTQEAEEIISLRDEYPYSQVLQVLSAKVSKDHNFEKQQLFLQAAAVYSTDRSVLKEIISQEFVKPEVKIKEALKTKTEPSKTAEEIKPVVIQAAAKVIQQTIDSVDYADEILLDLKRLNELKLNFESLVAGIHTSTDEEENVTPVRRPPGRPKKKAEPNQDPLIESIKTTKKKIEPESSTAKEQIAIIDQFIKAQPSIATKLKADINSETPAGDLAEIKSGEFSDTIVSETLAEILIRQGKKEKAIEV